MKALTCLKFNKRVYSKDEHLSRSSRAAWVEQSLLRPMPKNPYAIQASCAPPSYAALPDGRKLADIMEKIDAVKKGVCDSLSEVGVCAPPYTGDACADLHGCFQQNTQQRTCYRKDQVSALHGLSFGYSELFGEKDVEKMNEPDLLMDHAELLKSTVEKVRDQGVNTKVLVQARTNIVRWTISRMVHSVKVNGRSSQRFTVHDDDTITIHSPGEIFSTNAGRVAELITMGMRVDPTMKVMFYEDIARNIDRSLADVMQYCEVPASSLRAAKTNKKNVQSHEKMPKDYIRNFDEVLEKMKDYPCMHRQLLHPSKTDVFNLPMEKSGDEYIVNMKADCPVGNNDVFLRTLDEYLA
uniref:Uncharacterized protein n=2 Tax=Lotharella globosa TaxID=91324 RepID=A0A7S3Z5T2_9EUKA